ncbi:hypothetical protein MKX08_000190 [Trichoderma sp. CBMAI-0020]|nr:hypothetical protein MKX08_000190 [Trichoderma sp. CBMAI-0020]
MTFSHVYNSNRFDATAEANAAICIQNLANWQSAVEEISTWPEYSPQPLHSLPNSAKHYGIRQLFLKDESKRFGIELGSFKALGAPYAVYRILATEVFKATGVCPSAAELRTAKYRSITEKVTVCVATDGNQGRGLAYGAKVFGCRCVDYIHRHVSKGRARRMMDHGAVVIRVDGEYEASVGRAKEDARMNGWHFISSTSWTDFDSEVPRDVMNAYMTVVHETLLMLPAVEDITHVFVCGGVGSVAAAVFQGFYTRLKARVEEIEGLRRKNAEQDARPDRRSRLDDTSTATRGANAVPSTSEPSGEAGHEGLVTDFPLKYGPWFDNQNAFQKPILIGETADAAFATRFRQAISSPQAPEPTHLLRLHYATDESLMIPVESDIPWPSYARAAFLVEAALKYLGRCCYIVHEDMVMGDLARLANSPSSGNPSQRAKFLALFAIGELYTTRSVAATIYPGLPWFSQSSNLLGVMEERPGIEYIEILLLLSFYSMSLNRRCSAYIYIGTAMRAAIVMGLHLNIPIDQLSEPSAREHRKRLFWSAYMFDRIWGSYLNHPVAIQDEEIEVDYPGPCLQGIQQPNDNYHGERLDDDLDTGLFEKAVRCLHELKDTGNYVAQEYCSNLDFIKVTMAAHLGSRIGAQSSDNTSTRQSRPTRSPTEHEADLDLPQAAHLSWTQWSLEQLLTQPTLDPQFLEAALRDECTEGMDRTDLEEAEEE